LIYVIIIFTSIYIQLFTFDFFRAMAAVVVQVKKSVVDVESTTSAANPEILSDLHRKNQDQHRTDQDEHRIDQDEHRTDQDEHRTDQHQTDEDEESGVGPTGVARPFIDDETEQQVISKKKVKK
jgi:hypothetical protein